MNKSNDGSIKNPNVTHLRHDIDSGRTGDKAPGFDPAAAPLGTDEEAAGTPPSTAEIEQARRLEGRDSSLRNPNAVEPDFAPSGSPQHGKWSPIVATAAVLFGVAMAAAGVLLAVK